MPSRSPRQARLMAALAHGWKPPAGSKVDVPVEVAKEFNEADTGGEQLKKALAGKGRKAK